ncbi:MAG: hypothetical protein ACHQ9S_10955 [Candidatus Binatia bacterium]
MAHPGTKFEPWLTEAFISVDPCQVGWIGMAMWKVLGKLFMLHRIALRDDEQKLLLEEFLHIPQLPAPPPRFQQVHIPWKLFDHIRRFGWAESLFLLFAYRLKLIWLRLEKAPPPSPSELLTLVGRAPFGDDRDVGLSFTEESSDRFHSGDLQTHIAPGAVAIPSRLPPKRPAVSDKDVELIKAGILRTAHEQIGLQGHRISKRCTSDDLRRLIVRRLSRKTNTVSPCGRASDMSHPAWGVALDDAVDEFVVELCELYKIRWVERDAPKNRVCLNCENTQTFATVYWPLCPWCLLVVSHGLDADPYYLSDYERWKSETNITNDFFPNLQKSTNQDIGVELRSLVTAIGHVPPADLLDYDGNPGRDSLYDSAVWCMIMRDDPGLIRGLSRTFSGRWYKGRFGSWLKALVIAGVLDETSRRGYYGIVTVAADGHDCRSLAEKTIDDWLSANGVEHEVEPGYPRDPELNRDGRLKADWRVGGTVIEYFGLLANAEYKERVAAKRKLCEKYRIVLIALEPSDLFHLHRKLGLLIG